MYFIGLVDDEDYDLQKNLKLIKTYQATYPAQFDVKAYKKSIDLLHDKINLQKMDVLFLDIEIGAMNGIELGKWIKRHYPDIIIVYITRHDQYAVEAFNLRAYHYMMKPLEQNPFNALMKDLLCTVDIRKTSPFVTLKINKSIFKINLKEALYVEKKRNLCTLVCTNRTYEVYSSLEEMYKILSAIDERFFVCHQGYIVNMDHIVEISGQEVHIRGNTTLPVSKSRSKELREKYIELMGT